MFRLSILEPPIPSDPMQNAMQFARDSTISTMGMSVVGGYGMGFIFSLFGSMMMAETATESLGVRDAFRHYFRSAHRLGYNFAFFGLIFTGIEVALEKRRGKKDVWNPTASGAVLGGFYGYRAYRVPGLTGGFIGGAFFSILFERLMDAVGMAQH